MNHLALVTPVPAIDADLRTTIIIPCLNEAASIGDVVTEFRRELPAARIVVVDNASTDDTAAVARAVGAEVVRETRRGKGHALIAGVRHAGDTSAVYIMVDGDGTYPASGAHALLDRIRDGADMAIGTRLQDAGDGAFPKGHSWGNRLFIAVVRVLFGLRTLDVFSGYRAFTRRMLQTSPLVSTGFEIEVELSIQAHENNFRVDEVPIAYGARRGESHSKLRTFRDGYRILLAILALFRDYRPMAAFGTTSAGLLLGSLATGSLVIEQYLQTGQVLRIPLAVLAAALFIMSALSLTAGVLVSSVNRRAAELRALLVSGRR
jgi:glycosyltransferase involved in cell wall biosynthesis